METLTKLIDRCNEMDIPEQLAAFHNANLPYDAKLELAALRKAGEKMALQLRILSKSSYFTREDATALAEWEAANK